MAFLRITVDGYVREVPEGTSLAEALALFSPYGDEATVARVNGVPHKSVDEPKEIVLREGDVIDIYPLVIGG